MAESTPKSYSTDPALYLYTSLTSGSSHIVTATSRMETILKANKISFKAIDIATDEKARMLWGRRAGKDESGRVRKIPGLVQMGLVIGDIVEVEDWNEYGELKQHIQIYHEGGTPITSAAPTPSGTPSKTPAPQAIIKESIPPPAPAAPEPPKAPAPASKPAAEAPKAVEELPKPVANTQQSSITLTMRQLGQEAAQKAKEGMKKSAMTTQTFSGQGKAEPVEKGVDKSAAMLPPIALESNIEKHTIETPTLMQSPTSSAWKNDAHTKPLTAQHSVEQIESLQSPSSTTWKSVAEHGGLLKPEAPPAKDEDDDDDKESEEDEDKEDEGEEEVEEEEEDDDDDNDEEDDDDDDEEEVI